MTSSNSILVIGAGPAGLTAAYDLAKNNVRPLVLEKADKVGGIARTEVYKGYRFDIGGHRFYTKVPEVQQLWKEVLGDDFLTVPRLSRIHYQGKFYPYPLHFLKTLWNLGPVESARILLSYLKARLWPAPQEDNFEQWVINRFGERLYRTFFKTYTEKVWGIPCHKIQADWAAQRIMSLSLVAVVSNALFGGGADGPTTLINEFHYPVLGPGMMWERFQQMIDGLGGQVELNAEVVRLTCEGDRITSVVASHDGEERTFTPDHVISSMPVTELVSRLTPPVPGHVLDAAQSLSYRAFVIVVLIVDQPDLFPDNWIYIHTPGVKVGRIQNFKTWSAAMVPDPSRTSLGMEYFCTEGDEVWRMPDDALIALAKHELQQLGLADSNDVVDGLVLRQPKAYPVYDAGYREHVSTLRHYLASIKNLQTIGRNGMHRYNNQDHAMLTGLLASRNLRGEDHDLWNVNTERSYYEDFATEQVDRDPNPD